MSGTQLLSVLLLWALPLGGSAHPSSDTITTDRVDLQARLASGVEAYEAGGLEEAAAHLRTVFTADPAFHSAEHGAAAYWLGAVYREQGRPAEGRRIWKRGLNALNDSATFDARLADVYLQEIVEPDSGDQPSQAPYLYQQILAEARPGLPAWERSVVVRHVAQLMPLLPEARAHQIAQGGHDASLQEWTLQDGAGAQLLRWWRRQDPMPTTAERERMEEHLKRVAFASEEFANEERVSGLDDRGLLYVRLGAPAKRYTIGFNDAHFYKEVFRFGVPVSRGDFPDNEIWNYRYIDDSGRYIFVRYKEHFYAADASELLPPQLRRGFNPSDRSQNKAYSTLAAMRYIYERLAMYYHNFGGVFNKVDAYMTTQEHQQSVASMRQKYGRSTPSRTIGAGIGERQIFPMPGGGFEWPSSVADDAIRSSRRTERELMRARDKAMPRQYTDLGRDLPRMPVSVRTARFLQSNGATRTEVYWSSNITRPAAADDQTLIDMSIVQHAADYRKRNLKQQRYLLDPASSQRGGWLETRTLGVDGTTDMYHLAVRWAQYEASQRGTQLQLGKRTARSLVRLDSLRPLNASAAQLEMSDIVPVLFDPSSTPAGPDSVERRFPGAPYPFSRITPETPLALYFEVYHLTFGAAEATRYTVEYEVERRTERGGVRGLFGGEETRATTTQTQQEGRSRRAKEYLMIDLSDWDGEGELAVTVTVTDEHSGQSVARTIDFLVGPEPEANE